MKITHLNIISFGRLKNYALDLTDRNFIYGGNESGKSTLAAFIGFMLLGSSPKAKKYLPWDGGFMEGTMEFSANGSSYSVYRRAGAFARDGRTEIICADTGQRLKEMPFKTETGVFASTAFAAQQSSVFSDGKDLGRAMREAVFGNEEEIEQAVKILGEKRRQISNPRGKRKGELDIELENLSRLSEMKRMSEEKASRIPEISRELEMAEAEYDEAAADLADGETDMSAAEELLRQEAFSELNKKKMLEEKISGLKDNLKQGEKTLKGGKTAVAALAASIVVGLLSAAGILAGANLQRNVLSVLSAGLFALCAVTAALAAQYRSRVRRVRETRNGLEQELKAAQADIAAQEARYIGCCERLKELQSENSARICAAEGKKQRLSRAGERVYSLKAELSAAYEEAPDAYDAQIAASKEKCGLLRKKSESLQQAEDGIRAAVSRLSGEWLPRLSEAVSKNISFFAERDIHAIIDENMNIQLSEPSPHGFSLYSGGMQDQLYLALRLAASEIIFKDEAPPLILDDPFSQYDSERTKKAIDILLNLPNKNQIIIFSCKKSPVFNNKEFNILTMR